jgi:hypothetical protein
MTVSIVCPLRAGFGHDRNAAWTTAHVNALLGGDAEIIFGESPDGPFCRSAAVNEGVARATGDVIVIQDADAVPTREGITQAMVAVADGKWARPFHNVLGLERGYSESIREMAPGSDIAFRMDRVTHQMPSNPGMICLMRRDDYLRIGGMDERFLGWGGEDEAFAFCAGLLLGRSVRVRALCGHLWHDPIQQCGHPNFLANVRLRDQYQRAYAEGNVAAMRALRGLEGETA